MRIPLRRGPRLAFEQLPDPMLLLDPESNAISVNRAARELLCEDGKLPPGGSSLARLGPLAAQLARLVPDRPTAQGPGADTRTGAGVVPAGELRDRQGRVHEVHLTPVCAEDGSLRVWILRLADVSQARRDAQHLEHAREQLAAQVQAQTTELQHLAERLGEERQQLSRARERLLVVEDIAGIGHWSWDVRHGELEFSPRAAQMLGVESRRDFGVDPVVDAERVAHADRQDLLARFARIRAGQDVAAARFAVQQPGEDQPRRFLSPPPAFEHDQGRVVRAVGLVQDVSARERDAERLERMNRELETEVEARTRDLAEVARRLEGFAYMATHDLRAPLRAINGHAAIVLEEHAAAFAAESREALAEIVRLANRLDGLIDDLRVLAVDAEANETHVRMDLAPTVQRLVRDWARAGHGAAPLVQCADSLPVEIDPVRGPLLWRHLLNMLLAQQRNREPGVALRIEPVEGSATLRIRVPGVAPDCAHEPLLAYLLRRTRMRLRQDGAGELLLDWRPEAAS